MPLKTFYEIIKLCEIAKKISNESGKASCGGRSYGKGVKQRVKGPIHIGVIDGYSGMAAVYADDKIKACRMYVDRVKAKGAFWGEN